MPPAALRFLDQSHPAGLTVFRAFRDPCNVFPTFLSGAGADAFAGSGFRRHDFTRTAGAPDAAPAATRLMLTPMRTRARRRLRIALTTLAAALLVIAAALAWIDHISDPPSADLAAARSALEAATKAEAEKYAPAELSSAKAFTQAASVAYRQAELSWLGFFSYEGVSALCESAREKSGTALRVALDNRKAKRVAAWQSLVEARDALSDAQANLEATPLGSVLRTRMVRSELTLTQARAKYDRGDYEGAQKGAESARAGLDEVNRRVDTFLAEYTSGHQAADWARWIRETLAATKADGRTAIIVDKMQRTCHLYRGGLLVRSYPVDLGTSPLHQKMRSGDRATPEGRYHITSKRSRGQTRYYKALLINYPNEEDRRRFSLAKKKGWISSRASVGGLIEIHGDGGRNEDWTLGCVALANRDMDHLFSQVDVGTPVTIVGTMNTHRG